MSSVLKPLLTPQEYLARERAAEFKSEFYRGEIVEMDRSTWEHNLIKDNFAGDMGHQLKRGACRVVTSDMRTKIEATGSYTYPDVIVVCGEPELEDELRDTLLNPCIIAEVYSDSTKHYDRGDKFKHYRQVSSLQEYILIAQDEPYVERHVRQANGDWLMTEFQGLTQTLAFTSVAVKIALADIYRGVAFSENAGR
jgi:Uma2 family endonuclease